MTSLTSRSVNSTRAKLAEIASDTLENIADQILDLEEEVEHLLGTIAALEAENDALRNIEGQP